MRKKTCPLDRNRAGDLSVLENLFTAERDSQLHHKGIAFVEISNSAAKLISAGRINTNFTPINAKYKIY